MTDRLSRRAFLAAAGTPLLAGPLLTRVATAAPDGEVTVPHLFAQLHENGYASNGRR